MSNDELTRADLEHQPCSQLRLFGKHKCPPYRYDPEAFVLAKHARMIKENALSGIRG